MKKLILMLTAVIALTFATPGYVYAQDDVGLDPVEVVIPDDTSSVEITDPGEIVTPEESILPDVPWGIDLHAYFANWLVFIALVVSITQIIKKWLKWEDNKAFILTIGVTAFFTAIGYFFKLGALADVSWWVPVTWFGLGILGSKLGYQVALSIGQVLGVAKKTT